MGVERAWARDANLAAAAVLSFIPIDWFLLGMQEMRTLVVRVAHAAAMAAYGQYVAALPAEKRQAAAAWAVPASTLPFISYTAATSGGIQSHNYPWLAVLPLISAIYARQSTRQGILTSVAALLLALPSLLQSDSPTVAVSQTLTFVTVGLVTVALTRSFRHEENAQRALVEARAQAEHQRHVGELERQRLEAAARVQESEARAKSAEQLATVGRIAAGVAHEMNNPLAVVMANMGFLRDELRGFSAPELTQALSESDAALQQLRDIVRDLKGLARRDEKPDLERCALLPLVNDVLRLARLRLPRRVRIEVEVAPHLRVRAHRRWAMQVLLNLVVNAADALEGREDPWVRLAATPAGPHVVITVEDNGPGLSDHSLVNLFQAGVSSKGRGTGLGLTLSRDFATKMGGELYGGNRDVGKTGARFVFTLPLEPSDGFDEEPTENNLGRPN